jgi:hypothetical protein
MHYFLPITFALNRNAQTVCTHYMYRYLYVTKRARNGPHNGPGVHSASNRNVYQEYSVG